MSHSIEEFVKQESLVWEALTCGDVNLDSKMLAENFLGIYPTGFATKQDHLAQLEDGPIVATFEIRHPRIFELAPDIVLFAYLAEYSRLKHGQVGGPERMFISSIWQQFGNKWKNIFSQDTPASS